MHFPAESVPLRQQVCDWIAELRGEMALASGTITKYEQIATRYAAALTTRGIRDWHQVTERDVRSILGGMAAQNASPASLRHCRSVYMQFHRWLADSGHAEENPVRRIRPARLPERLPRSLRPEQVCRLLEQIPDAPHGVRDRAILELAYSTGCRIGEILGTTRSDLNLDARTLRVMGKGSRERLCPFGDHAAQALARYTSTLVGPSGVELHGAEPLFPISQMGLWKNLQRYATKAGLGRVSAHQLRHSFATHLVEAGADLRSVQILLGHRSITSTQVYVNPSAGHLRKMHGKLPRS